MTKEVHFSNIVPLHAPPRGWYPYRYAITLDGQLAIMRTSCDVRQLHAASFDKHGAWHSFAVPEGSRARISLFDGREEQHCVEFPLAHYPHLRFDRLPDGRWVIASRMAEPEDPPSWIVGEHDVEAQFVLGDDLSDLGVAPDGTIWTGYGDIGAMTGRGVERNGIARFSSEGQLLWGFNTDCQRPKGRWVDEAECLNVSAAGVYAILWPNYVIAELSIERPRFLRSRTILPTSFATDGTRFLLASVGCYQRREVDNWYRLDLLNPPPRRGSRRLRRVWDGRLNRPERHQEQHFIGRGDCLHLVTDTHWHRLTINDVAAQIAS